ncbi:MAG: GtrA family protein [Clostridia bacterium]|nr:GtrA family protein [Clostridia bacterium]
MIDKIRAFVDKVLDKMHLLKYKELILYIIVGGGTTVVDWIVFAVLTLFVPETGGWIQTISPNIISYSAAWLCAVIFAYVFSRLFVFENTDGRIVPQFARFFASRFATLVLSIMGDILLCGDHALFPIGNVWIAKVIISVAIVIINYITSKLLVFNKKPQDR